jgi:beta-lactamase superfamily II metal-dependent hydrolase
LFSQEIERSKGMRSIVLVLIFTLTALGQTRTTNTLEIYIVDVEGGNATLVVSPSKESLLIDTGNANAAAVRDVNRIMEAVKDAGLQQIDHLITTHWHGDHFGGLQELASRIQVREFIDHGPNAQPNASTDDFIANTYPKLYSAAKHTVPKPGDKISVRGLDVVVITSAGKTIKTPLMRGAGAMNSHCANFKPNPGNAEDPQSVGVHITFGEFRTIHLGDLTRDKEFDLMCPMNLLGTVDVLLGLHHGQATSNSEVLVHAVRPRVAVMNNGTRKGGDPDTMKTLHLSPGLEDLWQMHFSQLSGQEYTVPGMFIANLTDEPQTAMPIAAMTPPAAGAQAPPAPVHNGPAYWIKVSAQQDGSFSVTNARNQFTKTYAKKK